MKFSIRDLFLVTMIVALVVGWLLDHRVQISRAEKWKERALFREAMPPAVEISWDDEPMPTFSAPAQKSPKK